MACRCPITCRYPMTRYTNASHLFSKIVVFVRLEQASTLETCTILHPFCFVSNINIVFRPSRAIVSPLPSLNSYRFIWLMMRSARGLVAVWMTSHSTSGQSNAIPSPTDSRSASGRGTSRVPWCTAPRPRTPYG
jgi:hypothetical protein